MGSQSIGAQQPQIAFSGKNKTSSTAKQHQQVQYNISSFQSLSLAVDTNDKAAIQEALKSPHFTLQGLQTIIKSNGFKTLDPDSKKAIQAESQLRKALTNNDHRAFRDLLNLEVKDGWEYVSKGDPRAKGLVLTPEKLKAIAAKESHDYIIAGLKKAAQYLENPGITPTGTSQPKPSSQSASASKVQIKLASQSPSAKSANTQAGQYGTSFSNQPVSIISKFTSYVKAVFAKLFS